MPDRIVCLKLISVRPKAAAVKPGNEINRQKHKDRIVINHSKRTDLERSLIILALKFYCGSQHLFVRLVERTSNSLRGSGRVCRRWGVQMILASSLARPAIFVAGTVKGRGVFISSVSSLSCRPRAPRGSRNKELPSELWQSGKTPPQTVSVTTRALEIGGCLPLLWQLGKTPNNTELSSVSTGIISD